jgi:anti-anti-sigma factor
MKTTLTLPLRRAAKDASADAIAVGPQLDASSARSFSRAVSRFADRRLSHVIIDMSKTRSVDSSGFGSLISGLKKLTDAGSTPIVVCSNPSVRRLMDFAGVTRMFRVVDRVSEARRALVLASAEAIAS